MQRDKNTGRIIVEEKGVEYLDKSVGWKSGDSYASAFKAEAACGDSYEGTSTLPPPTDNDKALHHIIPKLCINEGILKQPQQKLSPATLEKRRKGLEEYANLPHIHKPLSSLIEDRDEGQSPTTQDGKKLHASILWNPNNLVRGPKAAKRGDDPDYGKPALKKGEPGRVDQALLDIQSQDYKASVDNFLNVTKLNQPQGNPTQALKEFGKISKPESASYAAQKDPADDGVEKWFVKPKHPGKP